MHRFTEFINTANDKLAQELISPEAVFHVPGRPEPVRGPAGYLEIIGMMREGFPDIQWTLEGMVAEGDTLAARFTMRCTHRGIFFGVPPTGKTITVPSATLSMRHRSYGIWPLTGSELVVFCRPAIRRRGPGPTWYVKRI